jgi:hypothetical protein
VIQPEALLNPHPKMMEQIEEESVECSPKIILLSARKP